MNRYSVKVMLTTYHEVELDAENIDHLDDAVADYVSVLGHDTSEVDYGYTIRQVYDIERDFTVDADGLEGFTNER